MVTNQTTGTRIYFQHEIDIESYLRDLPRVKKNRGNQGRNNKPTLIDCVCAFDIETSYLPDVEQSFMYIWQFQLGDYTIIGRSWDEFLTLCHRIRNSIKEKEMLVVYVHNLSYEFQYLRGIYPFEAKEVFCLDRRKIARCEMFHSIEFRCSYIHSNMSLDQFTKKMKCHTRKLTGQFDYNKIRYPWTELTDDEMAYCINDVISLQEAIQNEMEIDGDTLETIPLTSTGYVRRKCKTAMRSRPAFYSYITDQLPDYSLYVALREAFRGGNTHANRFYVGQILDNVQSVDRSSSYPDVLVNHKYPVSYFHHWGPCSMDRFHIQKNKHKRACLIRIALFNVRLKNYWEGCPYLSKDKCRMIHGAIFDNGRILYAQYLETTITDIDYDIISAMYEWENPCIFDSWYARYGDLPLQFTDVIKEMYRDKTALKGDKEKEILYEKIKSMINALYGMTAQNPLKLSFDFFNNDYHLKELDPPEELRRYNKKAFLVYQWGVWVTAWARWELQLMIDNAGDGVHTESAFIYTDTDSVKFIGDISEKLDQYNNRQIEQSVSTNAYAIDSKGITHYMGVYEVEKTYDRFITWGAKRYAFDLDGETYVTTAGVVKRKGTENNVGGKELKSRGGLEAYKPGFTFRESGGVEAVYNDNIDMWIRIDEHDLHITDNVSLRPSEYTLGITGEYEFLLKHVELLYDLWTEYKQEKSLEL